VYDLKAHPLPMHVGETVLKYDQSAHLITLKYGGRKSLQAFFSALKDWKAVS